MKNKKKIIFLVSEDKYYIYDFINKVKNYKSLDIKLIVIQKYKETFKRKIILSLLFGLLNTTYLIYQISFKRSSLSIKNLCDKNNINYFTTNNLNNSKTLKRIKMTKADLIINLNVMKLIKKNFLKKINYKLINFHPGILPKYRGLYSTFYKLLNKEKFFGMSAHYMEDKIDSGPIISVLKEKINGKNLFDCYRKIYEVMIFKLLKLTINIHSKTRLKKTNKAFKIYKTPSFLQILKFKINLF